ncbi:MAG: ABC transporter permease, partial [Candidatus Portiera sp.]|nr:ABC transporter permease [Portiera sp.]
LPNAAVASLTAIPFVFTSAITIITSLDFLGYGLPPGTPSLGELILQAKTNVSAYWIGIEAFLVITTMLGLLVFIGEGLRNSFDPNINN